MTSLLETWNIGLSAWIIQDGNYSDFVTGETVEFAVEFYQPSGTASETCQAAVSATPVADTRYSVVAAKVPNDEGIAILDIGILVFQNGQLERPVFENDQPLRTELQLHVDPYFYFEGLAGSPTVPSLIYTWKIKSILRQCAPFIETVVECGPGLSRKIRTRDATKLGYEEIAKTDAWQDDDGFAEYILCCDLLPVSAKRESATAR